jgi:hypothetical protein
MISQAPGGPGGHRFSVDLMGARRRLGLSQKSLVQTGGNSESPFQLVRFPKPDWPDYWQPFFGTKRLLDFDCGRFFLVRGLSRFSD